MDEQVKQIKIYSWALSSDAILVILFVLWCIFTYKALIQGNFWGFAVHSVSEIQNDSYSYHSSEDSEDDSVFSDQISICSHKKADKNYPNLYSQIEKFSLGSFSSKFLIDFQQKSNNLSNVLNKENQIIIKKPDQMIGQHLTQQKNENFQFKIHKRRLSNSAQGPYIQAFSNSNLMSKNQYSGPKHLNRVHERFSDLINNQSNGQYVNQIQSGDSSIQQKDRTPSPVKNENLIYRENYQMGFQKFIDSDKKISGNSKSNQNDCQSGDREELQEKCAQAIQDTKQELQIEVFEDLLLGKGSGGTCVFEGKLHGRIVAVKRMLHQHSEIAWLEIKFLQRVDLHPNLLTYFHQERDRNFIYLAVEKCEGDLEHFIQLMKYQQQFGTINLEELQQKSEHTQISLKNIAQLFIKEEELLRSPKFLRQIMQEILEAVKFLHENNIVHRDIKPHNILINRLLKIKLSDMGLSKQLSNQMDSYHTEAVKGSVGWQPSEVILNESDYKFKNTHKTQKVDIFSLGCVFYYLMSRGEHPFGSRFEREKNILQGKYDLKSVCLDLVKERIEEFKNLIQMMIKSDPKLRSKSSKIFNHVFFWNNDKKLKLIQEISDKLEYQPLPQQKHESIAQTEIQKSHSSNIIENQGINENLIVNLNKIGKKYKIINPQGWSKQIDPCLVVELQKFRKYDQLLFTDLLRFIRNKKNHYRELSNDVKAILGETNESFMIYFMQAFPSMMIAVDEFVRSKLIDDPIFSQYYQNDL